MTIYFENGFELIFVMNPLILFIVIFFLILIYK